MGKRSRSVWIAVLAVTTVLALGCVPDPPPTETPVPTALAVTPTVVALHPGESLQLSAEVLDQNGEPMGSTSVAWTSDNDAVAEVSSAGLVRAITAGEATVTATVGALDAISEVTVTAVPNTAPELTITSPTGDVSVNEIDVVELAATATDAEDGNLDAAIAWTLLSTEPGAEPVDLGTGPTASAGPLAPGDYTITSAITDGGGLTAAAQIQVTVATCVVTSVLTPSSGTKDAGPLTLSAANSSDSCGRPLAYGWDCVTNKNPQKCADLRNSANNGDMVEYTFDIEVWEELAIQLRVCARPIHAPKCAVVVNYYNGAAPIMG